VATGEGSGKPIKACRTGLEPKEDLPLLLHDDTRTIRRDIRKLRAKKGIYVAMRGQIQDGGPGVSHRGVAIGHWLAGLESLEVARRINHAPHTVARYIHTFCRGVFLRRKAFHGLQIALTVDVSPGGVRTFLPIHEAHRKQPECARRFEEIDPIGARHDEAGDGGC
jgi:hypothetical protein